MAKLNKSITINLDVDSAQLVNYLANYYTRKPAELVRLLLLPALINAFVDVQKVEHPTNAEGWRVAHFNG